MGGTGIEITIDGAFRAMLDALARASNPDRLAITRAMGEELEAISNQAFEDEADPVTGEKWEPLKHPRKDGSAGHLLRDQSILYPSRRHIDTPEGTTYGSHLVYARIHQKGGDAGRGRKTHIPARPYMGVPGDFDRRFLNDPAVLKLLGVNA
jgi:phage virion morphogenesis protein